MSGDHWRVSHADGNEVYHCIEPGCTKRVEVGSRVRNRILDAEACKKAINKHWPRAHPPNPVERQENEDHWGLYHANGKEVYHCIEPGCTKRIYVGIRVRGKTLDAEACKKAINMHWPRVHQHKWVEERDEDTGAVRIQCREAGCKFYVVVGSESRKGEARSKDSCQNSVNYHWRAEHNLPPIPRGVGAPAAVCRSLLPVSDMHMRLLRSVV
jgi:hypothetical protein